MSLSVLLVDDSKLARMAIGRGIAKLRPDGLFLEADSAEAALELIDTHIPDVALLDYNLPGNDGLELARQIRSRFPDMPIALITANFQKEVVERAQVLQVHFIVKPFDLEELRAFVDGSSQ